MFWQFQKSVAWYLNSKLIGCIYKRPLLFFCFVGVIVLTKMFHPRTFNLGSTVRFIPRPFILQTFQPELETSFIGSIFNILLNNQITRLDRCYQRMNKAIISIIPKFWVNTLKWNKGPKKPCGWHPLKYFILLLNEVFIEIIYC